MRYWIVSLFLASMLFPLAVSAEASPVTRRDGFLLLWNSIHRAIDSNHEKPFADVREGTKGFAQISYAKYRGILDDDQTDFHPDDPLMFSDALLWLFRTRSVDDIGKLTAENLSALLQRYPLKMSNGQMVEWPSNHPAIPSSDNVTELDLLSFMRILDEQLAQETHEVSLYGEQFHGRGTAFGETFNMNAFTAAHRTFPYNTLVKVTNVRNGKSVTVRINDRGPYVEGRDMDLSVAAFTAIEDRSKGVLHSTFQRLGDATLVGQCGDTDLRRAVRITRDVRLIGGVPATLPLGKDLVFRSTRAFVLRSVRYPDGTVADLEDWILPGESHPFTPSVEGQYVFTLGSKEGRKREMKMAVIRCQ